MDEDEDNDLAEEGEIGCGIEDGETSDADGARSCEEGIDERNRVAGVRHIGEGKHERAGGDKEEKTEDGELGRAAEEVALEVEGVTGAEAVLECDDALPERSETEDAGEVSIEEGDNDDEQEDEPLDLGTLAHVRGAVAKLDDDGEEEGATDDEGGGDDADGGSNDLVAYFEDAHNDGHEIEPEKRRAPATEHARLKYAEGSRRTETLTRFDDDARPDAAVDQERDYAHNPVMGKSKDTPRNEAEEGGGVEVKADFLRAAHEGNSEAADGTEGAPDEEVRKGELIACAEEAAGVIKGDHEEGVERDRDEELSRAVKCGAAQLKHFEMGELHEESTSGGRL